jgi:hypothetical protein
MGRTDFSVLTVSFEPVGKQVIEQEVPNTVAQERQSGIKVDAILSQLLRCPSCDSKLSSPEAKMGRCLSCGCNLTGQPGEAQSKPFTIGI